MRNVHVEPSSDGAVPSKLDLVHGYGIRVEDITASTLAVKTITVHLVLLDGRLVDFGYAVTANLLLKKHYLGIGKKVLVLDNACKLGDIRLAFAVLRLDEEVSLS